MVSQGSPELWGIKEVAERSGLPQATIRYYDQQFEDYLDLKRGPGRKRLFDAGSLERLQNLRRWLKEEGLSVRQVRTRLSGGGQVGPMGDQALHKELADLRARVGQLEQQMSELREISHRALSLLEGICR
jgi:DNA-binding transcriptional MerR regulator